LELLYSRLAEEESKLYDLVMRRDNLKQGFWWLDASRKESVRQFQLSINDQTRVIENLLDDIETEWVIIKPHHGVFSQLFLYEILWFVPELVTFVWESVMTLLFFDILSVLFLGPLAFFFVSAWFQLGRELLPLGASLGSSLLTAYWLVQLPFLLRVYGASVTEFAIVYTPFTLLFVAATRWLVRTLRGSESIGTSGWVLIEPEAPQTTERPKRD